MTCRTKSSTAAIRFSVSSIRRPEGARTYISNEPASTSGKNSLRSIGQKKTMVSASRL